MGVENIFSRKGDEATVFRHSGPPHYQLDRGIVGSENPEGTPRARDQWFDSDLSAEAIEFAKREAKAFFDRKDEKTEELAMDPEKDALFFVSSDLVRAAETAKIFLDEARSRGFEIILPRGDAPPEKFRNKAEEIGGGYIRRIQPLTLDHLRNMLQEVVFQKDDYIKTGVVKYPEKVSPATMEGWQRARDVIETDNRGTWGANYAAHSEAIAKIFPKVKSAQVVYESKFKNMVRLLRFAQEKIHEQKPQKNIKILGFSHENSFIYFLEKYCKDTIAYCESIGFKIVQDEENKVDNIHIAAKGKTIKNPE